MEDQSDELLKLLSDAQSAEYVPPRMIVHRRAVSSLEIDVLENANHSSLGLNLPDLPPVFLEDTEAGRDFESEADRVYWKSIGCDTPRAAIELAKRIHGLLYVRQQERVEIARALGPNGTRAQYEAECERRNISPWT